LKRRSQLAGNGRLYRSCAAGVQAPRRKAPTWHVSSKTPIDPSRRSRHDWRLSDWNDVVMVGRSQGNFVSVEFQSAERLSHAAGGITMGCVGVQSHETRTTAVEPAVSETRSTDQPASRPSSPLIKTFPRAGRGIYRRRAETEAGGEQRPPRKKKADSPEAIRASVSAPGSALGSVPTVALSSAQAKLILTRHVASHVETARKKSRTTA
jgi:hypothetical protein